MSLSTFYMPIIPDMRPTAVERHLHSETSYARDIGK